MAANDAYGFFCHAAPLIALDRQFTLWAKSLYKAYDAASRGGMVQWRTFELESGFHAFWFGSEACHAVAFHDVGLICQLVIARGRLPRSLFLAALHHRKVCQPCTVVTIVSQAHARKRNGHSPEWSMPAESWVPRPRCGCPLFDIAEDAPYEVPRWMVDLGSNVWVHELWGEIERLDEQLGSWVHDRHNRLLECHMDIKRWEPELGVYRPGAQTRDGYRQRRKPSGPMKRQSEGNEVLRDLHDSRWDRICHLGLHDPEVPE
ncbi:hypothetical protein VTK73DRAFT_4233 [Phialemonium thermophilum]|uniref:Uncharacterized protein n=1 Tax=Phialemonium thermophilum TaxID=223376 RepID=A0ABR3VCA8_9PEZI